MNQIDELLGLPNDKGITEVKSNDEFSRYDTKSNKYEHLSPSLGRNTSTHSRHRMSNEIIDSSVINELS